jgi:hypothetical protein
MKIGDRVICGRYQFSGVISKFSPNGRIVYVAKDDGTKGLYYKNEVTVCQSLP